MSSFSAPKGKTSDEEDAERRKGNRLRKMGIPVAIWVRREGDLFFIASASEELKELLIEVTELRVEELQELDLGDYDVLPNESRHEIVGELRKQWIRGRKKQGETLLRCGKS